MNGARVGLAILCLAGCTTRLPAIDPSAFVCMSNAREDGELPCADDDFCVDGACSPRLGCQHAGSSSPGCDPDFACESFGRDCQRCALRIEDELAGVTCEPGVHTTTSARPADPRGCACPDGTACVAFATSAYPEASYPLFVLPNGGPWPSDALPVVKDDVDKRRCVRGCASEADCPAAHTCRPAATVNRALLESPTSNRSTIGVCWPDRISPPLTPAGIAMAAGEEPDALACRRHADCPGGFEPCRFRLVRVGDHPLAPLGLSWGDRRALVARCATEPSTGGSADIGCTLSNECRSGLCLKGRCARPCDPSDPDACPMKRGCVDVPVSRRVDGSGLVIQDRVQVCAP